MDKLATMDTIGSSFRPWLSCQGICLLNRHQTGDTDSVQPVILLPVQRDSQETFIPCEARILWYSADRTSSQQLRDTTDFLGFMFYWARSRKGHWRMWCKTRRASLRRAKKAIYDWCRRHRHQPVEAQHAALGRRLRGHCNSFGVSGNFRRLLRLVEATKRAWYKWLCRRSQRKRLTWERFTDFLRQRPLPHPRITVRIWGV